MKSTEEKIKIMQAFLGGKTIKLINHDDNNSISLHTKDTVKDLMWDWMGYDYEIYEVKGIMRRWANIDENGNVRNGKFFSSENEARMNRHTCDVKVGVKVHVKYEEVM